MITVFIFAINPLRLLIIPIIVFIYTFHTLFNYFIYSRETDKMILTLRGEIKYNKHDFCFLRADDDT